MAEAVVENVVTAALVVVAAAMTLIAARAWRHTGSRKVALLTLAFGLFLVKGLVLSVGLFRVAAWESLLVVSVVVDLLVLATFYLAVLR